MRLWWISNAFFSVSLMLSITAMVATASRLSPGFYEASCPGAESAVRRTISTAKAINPAVLPKLLRLFFHDCFVEGCDASVLLDSTPTNAAEKSDPANSSLGGFNLIDTIKSTLEGLCPNTVSCADILALAARDAVIEMGGPSVQIPTGRRDGFVSSASNVRFNLPDSSFNLDQLNMFFENKGLSQQDIVVLSGAHTVGVAHCSAFNDRFSFTTNGSVASIDASINPNFAQELLAVCPSRPNPFTLISNDQITPRLFDNAYYRAVQAGKGLFHSDEVLFSDPRTRNLINLFAADTNTFFFNWEKSFLKLSKVGVKTGAQGEIRKHCRIRNF